MVSVRPRRWDVGAPRRHRWPSSSRSRPRVGRFERRRRRRPSSRPVSGPNRRCCPPTSVAERGRPDPARRRRGRHRHPRRRHRGGLRRRRHGHRRRRRHRLAQRRPGGPPSTARSSGVWVAIRPRRVARDDRRPDRPRRFAFGERVAGADPVEPTDRFRIASISKTITAIVTMRLVEAGHLDARRPRRSAASSSTSASRRPTRRR